MSTTTGHYRIIWANSEGTSTSDLRGTLRGAYGWTAAEVREILAPLARDGEYVCGDGLVIRKV